MGVNWRKAGLSALLAGAVAMQGGAVAWAADSSPVAVKETTANYGLTKHIRAALKNIAVVKTDNGLQLSATVRVYNGGQAKERLPEHELHVRTSDGLVYKLQASASNKGALQPKEIGELTYMSVVDSEESLTVDAVSFVHVDVYQYPKKITELLKMPARSVWYETGGSRQQQNVQTVKWGETFIIPGINSGILYTPVDVSIQHAEGNRTAVITLLAENPAQGRVKIPEFRLDASSAQKTYDGQASAGNPKTLEPGEKADIHFTVPIENDTEISAITVMSQDVFVSPQGNAATPIYTGKLNLVWPSTEEMRSSAASYEIGSPISFDDRNAIIDNETEVALMELHLHENPEEGYKTAIAKFKVTNRGDSPKAFPLFETEMVNGKGIAYRGTRQANVTGTINPDLSYVVSYSYQLPKTEDGSEFVVKLLDAKSAAPYATKIASLQTAVQTEAAGDTFSLYPFDVELNSTEVSFTYVQGMYNYKIRLDLDIAQADNVVVDNNFSKLRFEIVDGLGRVLGAKDAAFTGTNKLVSGKQTIDASNIQTDQFVSPVTLNIYEVIDTPIGVAKRLLVSGE